ASILIPNPKPVKFPNFLQTPPEKPSIQLLAIRMNFVLRAQSLMGFEDVAVESGGLGGGEKKFYDAIVIGSGIGGLVAATQLAVKGATFWCWRNIIVDRSLPFIGYVPLLLKKKKKCGGNLNLITQALAAVGCEMEVIPDPTTVHFHLPNNLSVRVYREYSKFISEMISKLPHEKKGILKFYGESFYLPQSAGDIARKFIKDPECFIVSTVNALQTPMINAGMGNCCFCCSLYCFHVGVRLSDGREFSAKTVISNATRWDTFGKLLKGETVLDSSLAPERRHILHIFKTSSIEDWQGLSIQDYEVKKELVADEIISRLENKLFPGLNSSIAFTVVGTPETHRRYLAEDSGTYGPMPQKIPKGHAILASQAIDGLYCVGDSCFPGQGVIAVVFSGVMCAHQVAADIGLEKKSPVLDAALLRLLGRLRTLA
ncbi:LOW QUALITY PROTEIN: hypothetical protein RJ641_027879, partial [Dillenia turbinata]